MWSAVSEMWPHGRAGGFHHDALIFERDRDLLDVCVPFALEGVDAGEDVVLVCTPEHNDLLARALAGVPAVTVIGPEDVYPRAPAALEYYQGLAARQLSGGATGLRLIGEVPFGDSSVRWREWGRYESACNVVFAPLPIWSICAYDATHLGPRILDTARLTHPFLRSGPLREANSGYLPPRAYFERTAEPVLLDAEYAEPTLTVVASTEHDVVTARNAVHDVLARIDAALHPDVFDLPAPGREVVETEEFVLAVHEVIVNALRHGIGPATVRLWIDKDYVVVTVTDGGGGVSDPLTGFGSAWAAAPAHGSQPLTAGLLFARRLCDDVTFRRGPDGFTVRLRARLDLASD